MKEQNEMDTLVVELREHWPAVRALPDEVKKLQEQTKDTVTALADLRRGYAGRLYTPRSRPPGEVSDECACDLAARFVQRCMISGTMDALCSSPTQQQVLVEFARSRLQVSTRAALTTTEIPLPTQYGGELRELISEFGVVRRRMQPYPIGMGTSRPARMGARPTFGAIAMSAPFGERSPSFEFASLESHKLGGIVRVPRELDEQSIVGLGKFLARYGAVEFARAEDTWGFLADGSGGFDGIKGIVQIARDKGKLHTLAATKVKPSDATLEDFRLLRLHVNKAALNGRRSCYYMDSTWEARLPAFRSAAEPGVYQRRPDGTAVLDGYPIVWTDVLTPYGTADDPDAPLAVFGSLDFWWFGEHGTPRIDTSEHVWFVNDQLAVRFIEEIDFDYCAPDATAVLLSAAA